ncbi:MAG: TusE/DsrC/DsvC family sulfur relay protein [Gammaproteobacteria bacterium]|nr:TusE/DsrC/DsvC family sulfur relay protein [Gammaproteobacteria bacterium]
MAISDYNRDGDGFLVDPNDWNEEFAMLAAEAEGLQYGEEMQEVITWARSYYAETGLAPTIREFGKSFYKEKFGKTDRKAPVKYLANLTNGSGMKVVDKIAGLPKPTGCV